MPSRLLFCRELLDEIFGYFPVRADFDDEDGFGKTEWHTNLINCALACHPLQDPALNVLWSHLHRLDPLLLLLGQWKHMPSKKNSRGQALELNPVMVLCDDFSPADFQRFQLHARRVVHVDVLNASPIDPALWRKMSEANGRAPLFPRLRHAGYYITAASTDDLLPLIPRGLRSLDVRHWDERYARDASHSNRANNRLKRMLQSRDVLPDTLAMQLADHAPGLSRLRIHTPRFECLFMLQRFTRLTHLTLNIRREFNIAPGEGKTVLSALESLVVTAPVKSLKALAEEIDCPLLRHLDVRPKPGSTMLELQECLESFAFAFGSGLDSLVVWSWRLSLSEINRKRTYAFSAAVLSALAHLPNLRSLKLAAGAAFLASGFALEGICAALPELRALSLGLLWEPPSDNNECLDMAPPNVSINTLLSLREPTAQTAVERWCPHLHTLELQILDLTSPTHVSLRRLGMDARGQDPTDFLEILMHLLYRLEMVEWLAVPHGVVQQGEAGPLPAPALADD